MQGENRPKTFLSTPSARRATGFGAQTPSGGYDFYPRPPRGGRPFTYDDDNIPYNFYPRPPRGGRQCIFFGFGQIDVISIHALREEGDGGTLPRGCNRRFISIHALREEGDVQSPCRAEGTRIFLSTPSARRATSMRCKSRLSSKFLSTPSARRATAKTETKSLFSYKLYNILHEFRRALIYNGSKNYPNHAK